MQLKMPLTYQVLILVMLPLIFQLCSLVWLGNLLDETEAELKRANHAKNIADEVNSLSNDVFYAIAMHGQEASLFEMPESNVLTNLKDKLKDHYQKLKKLTNHDPKLFRVATNAETEGIKSMDILIELDRSFKKEEAVALRKPMWKSLRVHAKNLLSKELTNLAKEQKKYAESSPELQAALRQRIQLIMVLAGGINLVIALFAAFYLTQEIANKIRRLSDNTYRLASGLPLNPVLEGSDELSNLDGVFHQMASELDEARRKERALVDNARDMICSINSSGKLANVNPASEKLLGYAADDLILTPVIDLVYPAEAASFLDDLEKVKQNDITFETQLVHKSGSVRHVSVSAHYSNEDDTIFCIIYDITERKETERLRRELVAMITHDLRTPLSTVGNTLEFLDSGSLDEEAERKKQFISAGKRNVKRMTNLVNDLLDIEKLKTGSLNPDFADVPLLESLRICRELHLGIMEEENIEVKVSGLEYMISADVNLFERLVTNLIANALKFSDRGTTVQVSIGEKDEDLILSVSDEGPGIEPDMLDRVFDRFCQAQSSKKKALGSGLGLTIAKAISDAHGFTIWVESEQGKGSSFKILIPKGKFKPQA